MKICGVYIIRCRKNGRCYIGSSTRVSDRISDIFRDRANHILRRDILRFGRQNFIYQILEYLPNDIDRRKRFMVEAKWQSRLKPFYNVKPLSKDGGEPLTSEIRMKISKANSGRKHTEEWKRKAAKRMKGNKHCKGKHWRWYGGKDARVAA